MKHSIYYDLVALAFTILILVDHIAFYRSKSRRNDYFTAMAALDMVIIALDVLITDGDPGNGFIGPESGTLLFTFYHILYGLFFFVGCIYFGSIVAADGQKTRTGRNALIVFLIQLILLIFNQFRGFCFCCTSDGYQIGPCYWLSIAMNLLFGLIMCVCTVRHPRCFSEKNHFPFYLVMFLAAASSAVQCLAYLGIVAGGYGTTICLMTLMFTVQRGESEKLFTALSGYNDSLETLVKEKAHQLTAVQNSIINGMADVITGKESYCSGHTERTTAIVTMITTKMKKDPLIRQNHGFYDCVIRAVPLHDIGEISISDDILDNYNNLSGEDLKIYQNHTLAGAAAIRRIFYNTNDPQMVTVAENITRCHHENYDGSGYPDGLKGEEIPLEARIVAMAEAFDLYISATEEKNRNDVAGGLKMIWDNMNKLYDPALVRFLFASREDITNLYAKAFEQPGKEE